MKIGIVGWNLGDNSFGATKPYLEFLNQFGDILILGPNTYDPDINLLVLPGGKDIINGNDRISFTNGLADPFLEHFDKNILPRYFENNKPILGICRGAQTLFRHTGVPIIQNIDWQHGYSKDEDDNKVNKLTFAEGYKNLAQISDNTVGSWHHQCSLWDDHPALQQWDIIAYTKDQQYFYSQEDQGFMVNNIKVIEYAKHKEKPIIAIQSHPERNINGLDNYLINNLLWRN